MCNNIKIEHQKINIILCLTKFQVMNIPNFMGHYYIFCVLVTKICFKLILRYMLNADNYILWQHIVQMFYQDAENALEFNAQINL